MRYSNPFIKWTCAVQMGHDEGALWLYVGSVITQNGLSLSLSLSCHSGHCGSMHFCRPPTSAATCRLANASSSLVRLVRSFTRSISANKIVRSSTCRRARAHNRARSPPREGPLFAPRGLARTRPLAPGPANNKAAAGPRHQHHPSTTTTL